MAQWKFMGSTAVAALVIGNAALADVTPEQVWENWKVLGAAHSSTITVQSETREGDTLVVKGLTVGSKNPQAEATLTTDEVRLRDKGDGSVEMTMSDSSKMVVHSEGVDGAADTLTTLSIGNPGLVITASGTVEETRYDFTAPKVTLTLDDIQGPGAAAKNVQVEVAMTNLAGNYLVSGTTERSVASNISADNLSLVVKGDEPENGSKVDAKVTLTGLSGLSSSKVVGDVADLAAALKAGTEMEGSFTYGGADAAISVTDENGETKIVGSNAGGDLTFAMNGTRLAYGATAKDAKASISGGQLPMPQLDLSYKEGAFSMVMPVSKSDTPSEFAFLTRLVDLSVSDEIWAMLDPTAQLPRDPLTVVVDTKGMVTLSTDLLDEAAMVGAEGAPGELYSLDINAIQLKLAGAELTGNGALTFDNTDMTTFEGIPAPTGKVNLKAVGVNGLLDKLTAMGLVPEDQMMGARMMLGMFAKVDAAAADTMTSEIEFKDKHFFVNGMQLQ